MLAAVGQTQLIRVWQDLFNLYGLHIGQMLLTRADLEDRERYLNARDTLRTLLDHRIIPVINENDAVATAEIKVGDNDNLSARAAIHGRCGSADPAYRPEGAVYRRSPYQPGCPAYRRGADHRRHPAQAGG